MDVEDVVASVDDNVGGVEMRFDDDLMAGGGAHLGQEELWKIR